MELEILRYIQSAASPFWDFIFISSTMLAEKYFAVAVLGLLYWNLDKDAGRFIGYALFTSLSLNNGVKAIFRLPRPIGEPGIRTIYGETATGYSFPSGHTQLVSTLYTSISLWFKRAEFWIATIVVMLLVGYSRMYLGVHYPKDVVIGMLLGIGTACACSFMYYFMFKRFFLYCTTLALMLPFLLAQPTKDYYVSIGLFCGFLCGIAYEERFVNFSTRGAPLRKFLRLMLGLALTGAVMVGLKGLLPENMLGVFIRYTAVGFFGFGIYPMIFKKMNL